MEPPESVVAGEFVFDPEDLIYPDHFPGNPVVPGSLIIAAFLRVVRSMAETGGTSWSVENFRFRRFIPPGQYAFRISGYSDGTMQCALYDDGRTVVTGIFSGSDSEC
jgi:3-hydroxyacyl-[acyl-carrier-protein] dehydratase